MNPGIGKAEHLQKRGSINKNSKRACSEMSKDSNNSRLKHEKSQMRIGSERIDDIRGLWILKHPKNGQYRRKSGPVTFFGLQRRV